MKGLITIGLIFIAIAILLFYFIYDSSFDHLLGIQFLIGVFTGLGLGQLIGGMVGYISKGSAVKEAQRRKEITQLQREKEELEKQAASLADTSDSYKNQNPQI